MAKKRIPLHMVTLFHPEQLLKVKKYELELFPHIKRDRNKLEQNREENCEVTHEEFHDRIIGNTGEAAHIRETWIYTNKLATCLEDFDVRLIITNEEGTQAKYKFEFRPDWVDQPDSLDKEVIDELLSNIRLEKRICIRQLWINPVFARFGSLPLEVPAEISNITANLVLGPFYSRCTRKANLKFENTQGVWWLLY